MLAAITCSNDTVMSIAIMMAAWHAAKSSSMPVLYRVVPFRYGFVIIATTFW